MIKTLTKIIVLVCFMNIAYAQTEATTDEGKKVILYEEGTWEYAEETSDSDSNNFSSDCSDYVKKEIDKVTGESSFGAKEMLIISQDGGKKGLGIYVLKGSRGSIIFSIQAVGAGNCIDDDDNMYVLFNDGSRIELSNDADFNCDANYTQYFGSIFGRKKELKLFSSKQIETMRIWTSDGYVEEDFNAEQSNQLMQTVACLID